MKKVSSLLRKAAIHVALAVYTASYAPARPSRMSGLRVPRKPYLFKRFYREAPGGRHS